LLIEQGYSITQALEAGFNIGCEKTCKLMESMGLKVKKKHKVIFLTTDGGESMLKTVLVLALVGLLGFFGVQFMNLQSDEPLSSPIARSVSERTYSPGKSVLHSQVKIDIRELKSTVNEQNVPSIIADADNLRLDLKPVVIGPITTDQVYFTYYAGLVVPGKPSATNSTQSPTARQRIKVFSSARLTLGEDWCIKTAMETTFKWVGGRSGSINRQDRLKSEELLREHSSNLGQAIANSIDCDQLQGHVKTVWAKRTFQAGLNNTDTPTTINIYPTSIGFTGVKLARGEAVVSFQTEAITGLEQNNAILPELPIAQKRPVLDNVFHISAPLLMVKYIDIQIKLQRVLTNVPLLTRTKYGTFTFTVHDLRVYPNGQSLVLALYIEAANTEEWINKEGWVYMTLEPRVTDKGESLALGLEGLSDGIEPGLSLGLRNTVSTELKYLVLKKATNELQQMKSVLVRTLVAENQHAVLRLDRSRVQLGNLSLAEKQLFAEGIYTSNIVIEGPIPPERKL